jgi:cysteine desulfurase
MDINPAIYLDYNATTPVAPEVLNEMLPHFLYAFGNPSSSDHILGWQAQEAVADARSSLAKAFNVHSNEIIFTGGATEGINLALRGLLDNGEGHIITLNSEHNAILDTCIDLEKEGVKVDYLNVDSDGLIDLEELSNTITEQTSLVTVMMVNNETGVIQPIKEISAVCKKKGILFMSDATQAIGKTIVDTKELGLDIMVGSAHKHYGPKGVGFLYIKQEYAKKLNPIITGGGQEQNKRAGTTNVPGIIGMAKSIDLAHELMDDDEKSIKKLRDYFENILSESIEVKINGEGAPRFYNTSNISFIGIDSERLMQSIGNRVAASRGSACSTGKIEPSHVLSAMDIPEDDALSAIRFSFGRYTTSKEVEIALELIIDAVNLIKLPE